MVGSDRRAAGRSEPACGHAVSACSGRASGSRSWRAARSGPRRAAERAPRRCGAACSELARAGARPRRPPRAARARRRAVSSAASSTGATCAVADPAVDLAARLVRSSRRTDATAFVDEYGPSTTRPAPARARARDHALARCSPLDARRRWGIAALERECLAGARAALVDWRLVRNAAVEDRGETCGVDVPARDDADDAARRRRRPASAAATGSPPRPRRRSVRARRACAPRPPRPRARSRTRPSTSGAACSHISGRSAPEPAPSMNDGVYSTFDRHAAVRDRRRRPARRSPARRRRRPRPAAAP